MPVKCWVMSFKLAQNIIISLNILWIRFPHSHLPKSKSQSSKKTNKGLYCSPYNIIPSLKCIKNIWLHFGQLMRLTYTKILKIGRSWIKKRSISLKMFWLFSRHQMESFWKIWHSNSAQKFKFLKQDASMAFKSPWKTSTLKPTLSSLIHTSRIQIKKITFFPP